MASSKQFERADGNNGDGVEPLEGSSVDPATIGGIDSGDGFDPAIHAGRNKRNADGTYTRKRGRKSTNRNKTGKTNSDLKNSVDALSQMLVMVHMGIAGVSKTPEMTIDKEEGDLLANAATNVMDQFDIVPDPKTQAIFGLIVAAGTVYGPRVVAIKIRKSREKNEPKVEEEILNGPAS